MTTYSIEKRVFVVLLLTLGLGIPLSSILVEIFLRRCLTLPPILAMTTQVFMTSLLGLSGLWYFGVRVQPEPLRDPQFHTPAPRWIAIVGLSLMAIIATNPYYLNTVNWEVGPHRFLTEMGHSAACIERLWQGETFYKDVHMLYGFLMYWPLFLFTKIFGHQLKMIHIWTLILEIISLFGIFGILKFLTRETWISLAGTFLCLFLFYPDIPYPVASYSRYHLGLLPPLLTAWGLRTRRPLFEWGGGQLGRPVLLLQL